MVNLKRKKLTDLYEMEVAVLFFLCSYQHCSFIHFSYQSSTLFTFAKSVYFLQFRSNWIHHFWIFVFLFLFKISDPKNL